ncbi:hypothetical protein AC1031_012836 [Aphanomyces cochlioides]|nr:hypothetical protein AC1031_012836 [Aphanomyces cochlioides]
MHDYITEAKCRFSNETKSIFRHEEVHKIVSVLEKFRIEINQIEPRAAKALRLLQSSDAIEDADETNVDNTDSGIVIGIAERPAYGKKKAKRMKIDDSRAGEANVDLMQNIDTSFKRLVSATEEKNKLMKNALLMRIFEQDPQSEAAQAFFQLRRDEFFRSIEGKE